MADFTPRDANLVLVVTRRQPGIGRATPQMTGCFRASGSPLDGGSARLTCCDERGHSSADDRNATKGLAGSARLGAVANGQVAHAMTGPALGLDCRLGGGLRRREPISKRPPEALGVLDAERAWAGGEL